MIKPIKEIEHMRQRYPAHWSDAQKMQTETWLASNTQAIELVKQGSRKPYYWPVQEKD